MSALDPSSPAVIESQQLVDAERLPGPPPTTPDGTKFKRRHGKPSWRSQTYSCNPAGCPKLCAIGCCVLLLVIFGVLLGVFLWARIPSVNFEGYQTLPNTPLLVVAVDNFVLNAEVIMQVGNPNFVALNFVQINATATYPVLPNVILGNTSVSNVVIPAQATRNVTIPVTLIYGQGVDPQALVLTDIANRCAIFNGGPKQPLTVDFAVTVVARVLAVPLVLPTYSGGISFACPAEFNQSAPIILGNIPS